MPNPSPIHASAHPHIMENILQHLPLQELVPLRALSRGMYLIAQGLIKSYQVTLVDHRWRCKHRCSPPWGVRTTIGNGETTVHCLQDLPVPGVLPKVLLFTGGGGEQLPPLLAHIGTIHTIQRTSPSGVLGNFPTQLPAGVNTVVDYLPLGKLGCPTVSHRVVGSERMAASSRNRPPKRTYDTAALAICSLTPVPAAVDKHEVYDTERYHHVVVPSCIRRYVAHISFHQWVGPRKGIHEPDMDIRFQLPDGAAVVFVLWPHFSTAQGAGPPKWTESAFRKLPRSLICVLWAAATAALAGNTPTLVNADRLSPTLFGIDKARTDDTSEVHNKVKRILRLQLDCMISNELGRPVGASNHRVNEAFKRIRFVTLVDWWAELGPTRRRYEGLALGGDHVGEHETYSLNLVQLYVSQWDSGAD